jgi:hypothetical protein
MPNQLLEQKFQVTMILQAKGEKLCIYPLISLCTKFECAIEDERLRQPGKATENESVAQVI